MCQKKPLMSTSDCDEWDVLEEIKAGRARKRRAAPQSAAINELKRDLRAGAEKHSDGR